MVSERLSADVITKVNQRVLGLNGVSMLSATATDLLDAYNKFLPRDQGVQPLNVVQTMRGTWLCVEYVPDMSSWFNPDNMYDEAPTSVTATYLGIAVRLKIIPPYMQALRLATNMHRSYGSAIEFNMKT